MLNLYECGKPIDKPTKIGGGVYTIYFWSFWGWFIFGFATLLMVESQSLHVNLYLFISMLFLLCLVNLYY